MIFFKNNLRNFVKGGDYMKHCIDCDCLMDDDHDGDVCECCQDDRSSGEDKEDDKEEVVNECN